MNKQTKNILIAVGIVGGGLLLYNMYNKKKTNKFNLNVKDQISKLQGQLVTANQNIAKTAIQSSPELQKTLTNLQNFRTY